MEIHGGERFATTSSFPTDAQVDRQNHLNGAHHHHHHRDPRPHPNVNGEQNESNGQNLNYNSNPPPLSGQKRPFHHTNGVDNGSFVKLYVVGIPRDATEQDVGVSDDLDDLDHRSCLVASVFGEYGDIIEIVLIKDKCTGIQQEYCFVKYATAEQAERALGAFQKQYKFPGAVIPMKVKHADRERERERERNGPNAVHLHKLYVGCVGKQALRWELEEIFSPFGVLEDVFVVRDEFKQNRGFAFVQFSCKDMAVAAIEALNGIFVMRGCDQPLIVRFAEPKKPRLGDSRMAPYRNDQSNGHVISNETKQLKNTPTPTGSKTMLTPCTGPASQSFNSIAGTENSIECDWSEHVSPDGELYYYNCTTCESRWEKPVEYAIYEQELDYLEDKLKLQQESKLGILSATEAQKV